MLRSLLTAPASETLSADLRDPQIPMEGSRHRPVLKAEAGASVSGELLGQFNLVVVVPAYNESRHIEATLRSMPDYLRTIIVVDDAGTDGTARLVERLAEDDPRIILLRHSANQGIGGAMVTGFRKAIELKADIVVKMDAEGQMIQEDLPELVWPLILGEADYAKGNRFRDFRALSRMPLVRRMGNMALSFLSKAAVGYWQCFDPCNGYVAVRGDVLRQLPLHFIQRSYFFETSMLAELYLLRAVVRDVPMPARYGNERSYLSIRRVLLEFPRRLARCFARRILLGKFVYDFSMGSIYLLAGVPMLLCGGIYGGMNWFHYSQAGVGAPTGTVVISAMLIILGFQLLLSAINEDLNSAPREPLCRFLPQVRRGVTLQTPAPRVDRPEPIAAAAGDSCLLDHN